MERPKNIKAFITNEPDEVIGYYGNGSDSYMFAAVPLSFAALVMCNIFSYGGIPLVALALVAWYKVLFPNIYFIINSHGVIFQSAFGFHKLVYQWSDIAAFHFTVKVVYGRGGSGVINKIVFQKKEGGMNLVLRMNGMESQFNEIHRKVEKLAAQHNTPSGGVVQL